mmetsp:Transcript_70450/g.206096  ORF Transcript_70450/g.206096 Transcript_70450/m.206096 type:complete len:426 (-) Transcript_70450:130-1407(-)
MLAKPLLPGKSRSSFEDVGSTVPATVINLLKNMVGAGLLNVCIAFQYASVAGGVMIMLFSSFVCTAGFLLIGFACAKTGSRSFRGLWHCSIGQSSEKVVDFVLFFHTLFSCVGYITMIGDFSVKSCSGLFPGSVFAQRRELSIYVITILAIFPLSLYKNLDSLKHTSVIGLVITALSCMYVFYDVVANAEEYGAAENIRNNFWYVKLDMFKTLALFNGSFSAHYNAPTYYAELRDRSFANFARVTLYSFAIATVLFTAFGIAGFARFGDAVLGNVLKSYSPADPMVQMSWFFMMVSTVFNFPHAFQRMRTSFNALRGQKANADFLFTTIFLLSVSLYMGVAFQDIAVIKMIKGATLGVSIMFIFPAIIYMSLSSKELAAEAKPGGDPDSKARREPRQLLRALCALMLVSGLLQGALALLVHYKVI